MRKNILVIGPPHSGKSTLLKKIIFAQPQKVGFITNEVLKGKERVGFEIETSAGEKSMLASIHFSNTFKVSRYGVHLERLHLLLPTVRKFGKDDFLYLDKIGAMQVGSYKFRDLVRQYLDSPNVCLMTMSSVFEDPFLEEIKDRKDVIVIEIDKINREEKEKFIRALLGKICKAQKYLSEPARFSVNRHQATLISDHDVRNLDRREGEWFCSCAFFEENQICSHVIALEEFLKSVR